MEIFLSTRARSEFWPPSDTESRPASPAELVCPFLEVFPLRFYYCYGAGTSDCFGRKLPTPSVFVGSLFTPLSPPLISWENSLSTYWVEDHGEEELAPLDALVQLLRGPWVVPVEDRVGEQPTGLPWENLEGE